jgi:hypothetical protein
MSYFSKLHLGSKVSVKSTEFDLGGLPIYQDATDATSKLATQHEVSDAIDGVNLTIVGVKAKLVEIKAVVDLMPPVAEIAGITTSITNLVYQMEQLYFNSTGSTDLPVPPATTPPP